MNIREEIVDEEAGGRGGRRLEARYLEHLHGVGAFAGGVAHDVNNLLAPILMSVDVLRGMVKEERGKQVLSTIERCARKGMDAVSQVLRLSARLDGESTAVQVRHLLYEIRQFVAATSAVPIEVVADYTHDLPVIEAQPTRIFQMLMSLCFDARDAMPQGGTLTIRAEAVDLDETFLGSRPNGPPRAVPGRYVLVAVSDTGAGCGAGPGLPLAVSVAGAHGGFVEVESLDGRGTTCRVYLPAFAAGP